MENSREERLRASLERGLKFDPPVSGPSFGWPVKAGAVAVPILMVWMGSWLTWERWLGLGWAALTLAAIYGVTMLALCWYFLVGRTTLDDRGIRQDWFWRKDVAWSDVKSARFMSVPGMGSLIPPRLMLRRHDGMYTIFNGATAELHSAFAQATVSIQSKTL